MVTQPSNPITIPELKCMYPDCGAVWTPRIARPKACPKCKRYNWELGHKPKKIGGINVRKNKNHSRKDNITALIGPHTEEFKKDKEI